MAKVDMDSVLDEGIKHAIHLLERNGQFFPFAVVRTVAGDLRHIQLSAAMGRLGSDDAIRSLHLELRRRSPSEYRSTAIVSDVRLRDRHTDAMTDAIRVEIDDLVSPAVTCYLPYALAAGHVIVGEMRAEGSQAV